jgi:hypothetical protein
MQQSNVVTCLGSIARNFLQPGHEHLGCYIELGYHIADIPEWRSILRNELSTWITVFNDVYHWEEGLCVKFNSVLRKIWVPQIDQSKFNGPCEESWALALMALGKE